MKCRFVSRVTLIAISFVFVLVIPAGRRTYGEEHLAPNDAKAILQKIVRAVASNRAQLKDVRAEILVITENHLVKKPAQTIVRYPNGTVDIVNAIPHATRRERIAISGEELRYEITGPTDSDEWNPDEAWLIKPNEWRLYQAATNRLQIWSRPEQLPGRFPLDPRDYGAPLLAMPLLKWLASLEAGSAQLVPQSDGTKLARLELAKGENRFLIECRSADGFLPSLVVLSDRAGTYLSIEIQYQPVLAGKAWFPNRMVSRSFQKTPSDPRSDDCRSATKTFITKLDVPADQRPRPLTPLQVPVGARVEDMRDSSN